MKIVICSLLLILAWNVSSAQNRKIDSLNHQLAIEKNDTNRVLMLAELCDLYHYFSIDSAIICSKRGLDLAQKIQFFRGEVRILISLSGAYKQQGEIPKSLELLFKGLQLAEEKHYLFETAMCLQSIGGTYWFLRDYPKAISFCKRAGGIIETMQNNQKYYDLIFLINLYIGISYSEINHLDSAFIYLQKDCKLTLTDKILHPVALTYFSEVIFKQGKHQVAFDYLHQAIELNKKNNDRNTNADAYKIIARFYMKINQPDSAVYYAKRGLIDAQQIDYKLGILEISKLLADEYRTKDPKVAYYYLQLAMSINDELYGLKKVQHLQKIITNEQQRLREIDATRVAYQNQFKQYILLAGSAILFLIGFILYRNNRQKQKVNILLNEQKEKVEQTLETLKSTQTQLIQSEKMASLGELTAGIAHEIQNPLNFVNNFSEVSTELVEELAEEQQKPDRDPELETELLSDLKQNLQKITQHGHRASSIVKGMLEHSRSSTGERQPTDINALADEYLRLAYQGLRAKDKTFNCELVTDFDLHLGKLDVVPQEMGRVLLNMYNNGFYAMQERSKQQTGDAYHPAISVSTKQLAQVVEIRIHDNGIGIPDSVKAKIFQPFFTTKPTGQGTGLGLSLSYDIVTKGHRGELLVDSQEGNGTTFIIKLPNKRL